MVIYTNNLAEKLFGFAFSREQLKQTALCGIVEDPNLALDIDLAINFNTAIRGDQDAARKFTNTLILSSAYIDYSTADFYTSRMQQYPIFDYDVARVQYIFDNLDSIQDYYAASNADERDFIDKLLDALKDCLNSPCNLFAATSESVASIADYTAKTNNTTIPTFSELKDQFGTAFGGLKKTLVNRVPNAVGNMFAELAIIGKGAFGQSVDMIYSKDPVKKQKIIDNALAGRSLDVDTTDYVYIPDLDAYTSTSGASTSILSQVASQLGGCFNKYQHITRYSPFNPRQNLSFTSPYPVDRIVDNIPTQSNSAGFYNWDYNRTDEDLNVCKGGVKGTVTPNVAPPGANTSDLRGSTLVSNNIRIDNDGITPPSFNDPYYQSKTSVPGLDATTDYFVVVPIGSQTPLGTKVVITNPDTGQFVNAIVGDRGPAAASVGEVSFAVARDLGVWSGNGDSVRPNSQLQFEFLR